MVQIISVQIMAASLTEANRIGRALVEEKLAACVNILPQVQSIYWWEGKIQQSEEVLLIAKTREDLFDPLLKLVRSLHSYTCPCIVAEAVVKGHAAYLEWVAAETTKPCM